MTDYENLLSDAASGLAGADGLAVALLAAASAFEAIRFGAEAYAGTDPELFATWLMTAAEAADGRDALLQAIPSRPAGLPAAPRLAARQFGGLARALVSLLAAISGRDDPAGQAARERAAACAGRIHGLLTRDTS